MRTTEVILTKQEKFNLIEISKDISKVEIIKNYTLSDYDFELIDQCRLDYNKLGIALSIGVLRHKGYSLNRGLAT